MPLYTTIWRGKFLPDAENMSQLIKVLEDEANELREMHSAGVELEFLSEDYYLLSTYDDNVAERFGLTEEEEEDEEVEYEYGGES